MGTTEAIDNLGKVYIVGAGLGDVAYLTVKAQQVISQAEVLVYDALVGDRLLDLVPLGCQQICVGKRGGQPSTSQTDIDRLLVDLCLARKLVVRLKSGDPFIFGRTNSEIQSLKENNCDFEVIPGISSALAAPLLVGIPLTDPVLSRGFAVVTAHEPDALDWDALARIDTLVVLMGGRNLRDIVHQLHKHGRSLHTSIAIIRWAGTPEQQLWMGILGNIVDQTANQNLSPCIIVVGEVVKLQEYLH